MPKDGFLPRRILVPYDCLLRSRPMVDFAMQFARLMNARLDILHIVKQRTLHVVKEDLGTDSDDVARSHSKKRLLRSLGGSIATVDNNDNFMSIHVEFSESVGLGVMDYCQANSCDLVISRKSGLSEDDKDSIDSFLNKLSNTSILYYRKPLDKVPESIKILIPLDVRRSNLVCAQCGIALARQLKSKVIFLFASSEIQEEKREMCPHEVQARFDTAEAIAREADVSFSSVFIRNDFVDAIVEYAALNAVDLIIMRRFADLNFGGSVYIDDWHSSDFIDREDMLFRNSATDVNKESSTNLVLVNPGKDGKLNERQCETH